jgi:hypothetical protein
VIQVSRSRTIVSWQPAELQRLRQEFDRQHYVRLPYFLEPELLQFMQSTMEESNFVERIHENHHGDASPSQAPWARDVTMASNLAEGLVHLLLMNDSTLFAGLEALTGCGRIGSFDGSVYRIDPAQEHYDSWHNDVGRSRMLAMSINLSAAAYEGGVLQIRDAESRTILSDVANPRAGDAVLFRISPRLQHRVSAVEGAAPRTALAGWFCSEPVFDFHAAVRSELTRVS